MAKEIIKPKFEKRIVAAVSSSRPSQGKPQSGTQGVSSVTAEQRQVMICEAAYYIAEHRGFEPGHDMDDWLAAEQQIDAALTTPASRGAGSLLGR